MLYTSVHNPKIKAMRKLKEKKFRDKENSFLIEGEHLIKEALKNNSLKEVLILKGYEYDIPVTSNYVNASVMKSLSDLPSIPKIIGVCTKQVGTISGNVVILDDIQDPGNLGTIIRSCVAFDIQTIILSEKCADIYSSKVLRSAQGMIFNINIIKANIPKTIDHLKTQGYTIYGTKVNVESI